MSGRADKSTSIEAQVSNLPTKCTVTPLKDANQVAHILEREAEAIYQLNLNLLSFYHRLACENPAAAAFIFGVARETIEAFAQLSDSDVIGCASHTAMAFEAPLEPLGDHKHRNKAVEKRRAARRIRELLRCHGALLGKSQ